jgi:tetratricopeptide (TPR) repeat protein
MMKACFDRRREQAHRFKPFAMLFVEGPSMYRDVLRVAVALLAVVVATPSAAADDKKTCNDYFSGHEDEAIAACTRVIQRNRRDTQAFLQRALAYNHIYDFEGAIADYSEAIRRNARDASAIFQRARAYGDVYDHERAVADYSEVIRQLEKSGQDRDTLHWGYAERGYHYFAKGDYDRAIADYTQAIRLNSSYTNTDYTSRAEAYRADRRVALVIGNSRYASVPFLPNPRRDAEAIASALREDGFQNVMLSTDLGRDAMRDALRSFRDAADTADWGMIYYAGHRLQIGRSNYLVPVDARLRDERDIDAETVSYAELEKSVSGAKALRLIILDACRVDPFAAQMARQSAVRVLERGLIAPPEPEPGMLVAYSARDGQVAEDGDADNSPFALALVKQLRVPGREVRRAFDFVRDDVLRATGRRQQPFTYGSLPGDRDFFFVPAK